MRTFFLTNSPGKVPLANCYRFDFNEARHPVLLEVQRQQFCCPLDCDDHQRIRVKPRAVTRGFPECAGNATDQP